MGDFLRRRVADNERYHLEGCQESLQERQLYFESMLASVRSVGPGDKSQVGDPTQGLQVHGHAAKGSFEGIDRRGGNPTHVVVWEKMKAANR